MMFTRSLRRALVSSAMALMLLLLVPATALACVDKNGQPLCWRFGKEPTINVVSYGYFVSNYGGLVCSKKVARIHVELWLTQNGSVTAPYAMSSQRTCLDTDRCVTTNLVFYPCNLDGGCPYAKWKTLVGGNYSVAQPDGTLKKCGTLAMAGMGTAVVGPGICPSRFKH